MTAAGESLRLAREKARHTRDDLACGRDPIDAKRAARRADAQKAAGAKASANLYSLIETAKACGIEPYQYLRYIFAACHWPRPQTTTTPPSCPGASTSRTADSLQPRNAAPCKGRSTLIAYVALSLRYR